jgi:hypothetical protein
MYLCYYVSMLLCIYVTMYLCYYVSMLLCIYHTGSDPNATIVRVNAVDTSDQYIRFGFYLSIYLSNISIINLSPYIFNSILTSLSIYLSIYLSIGTEDASSEGGYKEVASFTTSSSGDFSIRSNSKISFFPGNYSDLYKNISDNSTSNTVSEFILPTSRMIIGVYVSMCLCIYVSMCLCIYVSMCLCIEMLVSIYLSITNIYLCIGALHSELDTTSLYVHGSGDLSINQSNYLFIYLSIYLTILRSNYLAISLSLSLSLSLYQLC